MTLLGPGPMRLEDAAVRTDRRGTVCWCCALRRAEQPKTSAQPEM